MKLAGLKFLDPACGSGNFLTETYISLRRLENETLSLLHRGQIMLDVGDPIQVSIGQFYGIEINDFAVTVAKTALWIAESQMMKETEDVVHMTLDFLPLKSTSVGVFCLILAIYQLFTSYHDPGAKSKAYNASLLIGIGSASRFSLYLGSQIPRYKQQGIKFVALQSSGVFDPRGSRQMCMQACPLGSLLAGIMHEISRGSGTLRY